MITFSIITVTYNAAALCERTFRSVSEQTHPYVEHLIMDGASTDNTLALAREYQNDHPIGASHHEVKIFSEPDGGLYEAMNKGLRHATGDYVVFLNAGDVFPSTATLEQIASQIPSLHTPQSTLHAPHSSLHTSHSTLHESPSVLYGDTEVLDTEGNNLGLRRGRVPDHLSWRSFRKGMLVCHQAFYVRTDIARATPYDLRYRYSADVDWCIRVMKEAERQGAPLVNVHAVIAYFMQGGMTTVHHRDSLRERFRVMAHHYGLLPTLCSHVGFALHALLRRFLRLFSVNGFTRI